jgi:drug/metabolite transporter (DMT)-like permease
MTTAQNNTKGILFILVGMVVFSIQDALIKFIYEDSALYELYLGRTSIGCIFFILLYEIYKTKNCF